MTANPNQIIIDALNEKKARLLEDVKLIDEKLSELGIKKIEAIPLKEPKLENSDYDPEWSSSKKFAYLLKKNKRFLHFREAGEMINKLENTNLSDAEQGGKLTSGTQSLKKSKAIVKYQVGTNQKNCFWGIPSWLNTDGSIKKGHEFNPEYVYTKKNSGIDLFDDV